MALGGSATKGAPQVRASRCCSASLSRMGNGMMEMLSQATMAGENSTATTPERANARHSGFQRADSIQKMATASRAAATQAQSNGECVHCPSARWKAQSGAWPSARISAS